MFYLSIIGFTKTDDPDAIRRFCETKNMQTSAHASEQTPGRKVADFAIVFPKVGPDSRRFEFERRHQLERKAALPDVSLVFAWVEAYPH